METKVIYKRIVIRLSWVDFRPRYIMLHRTSCRNAVGESHRQCGHFLKPVTLLHPRLWCVTWPAFPFLDGRKNVTFSHNFPVVSLFRQKIVISYEYCIKNLKGDMPVDSMFAVDRIPTLRSLKDLYAKKIVHSPGQQVNINKWLNKWLEVFHFPILINLSQFTSNSVE